MQRIALMLLVVLILVSVWSPYAGAHDGSEGSPSGITKVHAGASASLSIQAINPRDTLQWLWTAISGSPANLTTQLFWTDATGREHAVGPDPAGQPFGTFIAPADLAGARLVWRNNGNSPAEIHWTYGCSPHFWRRPDIYLPALIPVFLLIGAQVVGKAIDARGNRMQRQLLGSSTDDHSSHISPQAEEGSL